MDEPPDWRNKGRRNVRVLTVAGEVKLSRSYFWTERLGGWFPTDDLMGGATVSPGARELCCTMGVVQDFAQGATDLARLSGLRVCKERLRQMTEGEALAVSALRRDGGLSPGWSADEARVDPSGPTRVYVGGDGVKIRSVTQAEKERRRTEHESRRADRLGAGLENLKPLPAARPGSREKYKEMKVGLFYNQDKSHAAAFATGGNHEVFAELLRTHADEIGLELADETVAIVDGGPWIRARMQEQLPDLDAILLDFYHLAEQVWDSARCCLGDGASAKAWAEAQLHEAKHVGPAPLLAAISSLRKRVRSAGKRKRLDQLRGYVLERLEMLDYRGASARGWDIGSGPTEAMCKNLTLRLKRTGMKWDASNAEAVMTLIALRESRQWETYWQTQRAA